MDQVQNMELSKDQIIQELIALLNQNQQKKAANDVFEMAILIDGMGKRLEQVTEELNGVRRQLEKMEQEKAGKTLKASTVITVVPLSTKIFKKRNLPTHVFVSAYKSEGLEQHSIALCEQVTALDYGRIIENMGKVDRDTLARITEAVQVQVGVFDKYN